MKKLKVNKTILTTICLWLSAAISVSVIFFYRFPNNFFFANFYAEDGAVFAQSILVNGFFQTLITPFNGYAIVGIHLLTGLAVGINTLLFDHLLYLPAIIAIVSYLFFGAAITLPIFLFRSSIQIHWLVLYALFASLVPLPSWDYAIIGTIGNTKFLFSTIALFAIIKLLIDDTLSRMWRYGMYVLIIIAAYTNPTVYILCGSLALPYILSGIREIRNRKIATTWITKTMHDPRFFEYVILAAVLGIQIISIAVRGIPEQPGYMNSPFEWEDAVEIFIARSFFFPLIASIYSAMNTSIVLWISAFSIIALYGFGAKKHWPHYTIVILSIFAMTGLFVAGRPGISTFFNAYEMPGGPGQFFYPQNIASIFLFFFWVNDVSKRFCMQRTHQLITLLLLISLIPIIAPTTGSFGKNNFMQKKQKTFIENAQSACATTDTSTVQISVYPSEGWFFTAQKEEICDIPVLQKHTQNKNQSFWIFTDNMQ